MDLGLQIGDILQMSPVKGEGRYRVRLIGLSPERSLLVTAPEVKRERVEVKPGQQFTVRAFAKDEALTFTTAVERVCLRPYAYLHLTYPATADRATARQSQRARVRMYGTARHEDTGRGEKVGIGDLSNDGAMLWCDTELGQVGESLVLRLDFDDQAGLAPVELLAEIRNVHEQPADRESRWRYGVEFTMLSEQATTALRKYVNKKLGKANL